MGNAAQFATEKLGTGDMVTAWGVGHHNNSKNQCAGSQLLSNSGLTIASEGKT
jgi:hypothetical protein